MATTLLILLPFLVSANEFLRPTYYEDLIRTRLFSPRRSSSNASFKASGANWSPRLYDDSRIFRDEAEVTEVSRLIRPLAYDLTVKVPISDNFYGFSSSLVLHFVLTRPSQQVLLHSNGLHSFRNISLVSQNSTDIPLEGIRVEREHLRLVFGEKLVPGEYLLTIGEFTGIIFENSSTGVFSRLNGQLITTHFQPDFARQFLPCVDEPSAKAPFRLTVIHPTNSVCQSNTIANDVQVVDKDWQRTIFSATPRLPSYLVSFSVMPDTYIQLSRQTTFGVTLRVHARERAPALRVLDIALAAMELLDNMLQTPLLLHKIDIVLVADYEGGMENWGHVLISEKLATKGNDARLMYVVAHEMAHHWIGDKATVDSWQYICLQEDITDYISYKVVGVLLGNDDRFSRFLLSKYVEIQLAEDFLSPEHSLLLPRKIDNQMISSHCYLKGVVHLQSLESIVGEDYMLSVIRNLVGQFSHFNLSTFIAYFDGILVDDMPLSQIYKYWYLTGGFPGINVENEEKIIKITQNGDKLWPLRLSSSSSLPSFLFAQQMTSSGSHSESPLLVNLNFTSFYRVNYDRSTWTAIFSNMAEDPTVFSTVGRAQLVSDFCYFYAQNPTNSTLKDLVLETVYSNPSHFDLCDWNLYWCYSVSSEVSLFTSLLRRLSDRLSTLFDQESSYGCRHGKAVHTINTLCQGVIGRKCIR